MRKLNSKRNYLNETKLVNALDKLSFVFVSFSTILCKISPGLSILKNHKRPTIKKKHTENEYNESYLHKQFIFPTNSAVFL